ncbi:MAG: protein kinase [Alphaproteobacteria bacterium]|nr:protein kinase [Alphaproteobacteria bacterium]
MLLHGRYRVERPLGAGGAGQAYLARDERSGRAVVVKELFGAAGETLPRELALLRQLDHPQVQRYVDAFVAELRMVPRLHLVTEFVPGRPLSALERRLPQAEVLGLVEQLLEIVTWLQRLSPPVLHRDIKPANLILRDDGRLVLIDFGVATDGVQRTFQHTMAAGTLGYQAPEQIAGDPGPASDLYSVGVTALELLTGRAPFELLSGQGLRWERAASHLEPWLRAWLGRCLAPEPAQRFQSAEQALAGLRSRAAPPAPPKPRAPARPRSVEPLAPAARGVLVATGVLLVGALALVALLVGRSGPAPQAPTPAPVDRGALCEDGDAEACLAAAKNQREAGSRAGLEQAAGLTARACELGSAEGCWAMAQAYEPQGWLGPDPEAALRWWFEACAANATNACAVLRARAEAADPAQLAPLAEAQIQRLSPSCSAPGVAERTHLDAVRCATALDWLRREWAGPTDPAGAPLQLTQEACAGGALWACSAVAEALRQGVGQPADPLAARGLYLWLCEQGAPQACDQADQLLMGDASTEAATATSPLRATSPSR